MRRLSCCIHRRWGVEMKLNVNGHERDLQGADPEMPLLWALRDFLALKGTKFGCGGALCGACAIDS